MIRLHRLRSRARTLALAALTLSTLAACTVREDSVLGTSNVREGAAGAPPAGTRYALGTPIDEGRLARWNVDAGPSGDALPAGSGTVAQAS